LLIHSTTIPRAPQIDAWRGIACILMIFYHFCYDLNYLQIISFDFYHAPFWLGLRFLIVTLFIGIAGISLHFATVNGIRRPKLIERTMILLSCALLISLISWFLFQKRFIFFGILHFMTVASLLGLLFIKQFWFNLIGGISLFFVGTTVQHSIFNHPWLQWLGLMTYKPPTEDYVPLLPWFGIFLLGMAVGQYGLTRYQGYLYHASSNRWILALAWLGRHSLLIYLLHQPLLLGMLWGLKELLVIDKNLPGLLNFAGFGFLF
jgi:uncharacterized membrane protein